MAITYHQTVPISACVRRMITLLTRRPLRVSDAEIVELADRWAPITGSVKDLLDCVAARDEARWNVLL